MSWRVLRDRLRALVFRDRTVRDIEDELQFHLEQRTAEYVRKGRTVEEARAAALQRVGRPVLLKERAYDVRGGGRVEEVLTDARYTLRMLRRSPGWAAAIIGTLAIGIGANTAIFAATRSVLLRPLPYLEPHRLVMIWIGRQDAPPPMRRISTARHVLEWRTRTASLSAIAVVEQWVARSDVSTTDGAERVRVSFASTNFFDVLGVQPALGRLFAAEDRGDPPGIIVLSDRFWRRQFGADPGIIGTAIDLPVAQSGSPRVLRRVEVIGVLPPRFQFTYPDETEAWLPRSWREIEAKGATSLQAALLYRVVARLKPGVSLAAAQANMDGVNAAMASDRLITEPIRLAVGRSAIRLEPIQDYAVGQTRPALALLLAATAFLLLVANVNVISLLLARTSQRTRELAVRAALGAGAGRVSRQLLTEAAVLAIAGGLAGIGVAVLCQPLIRWAVPAAFPRADEITFDAAGIAWAAGLSVIVAIVVGLLPSRSGSRADVQGALKRGGPTVTGDRRAGRWRDALVGGQVTVVVCLLTGSGLLLRTLWNLQHVDLGFDGSHVLTVQINQFDQKYASLATRLTFEEALLGRVRSLRGVTSAATINAIPFRTPEIDTRVGLDTFFGRRLVFFRRADADYFRVMRIPLKKGRLYQAGERGAIVISELAARELYGTDEPLGQTLQSPMVLSPARIVGIVGDVRSVRVDEPETGALYAAPRHPQFDRQTLYLMVRAEPPVPGLATEVRAIVRSIDPSQPIDLMTPMDDIVATSIADRRFFATTTLAFAAVALVLTIAGVYGVVARGVTERWRELGVRVVLGATNAQLISLILRQALEPVLVGLVAGAVGAAGLSKLLQRFLFGVQTVDPVTYVVVPLTILGAATVACFVPAMRVLHVDPIETLRSE